MFGYPWLVNPGAFFGCRRSLVAALLLACLWIRSPQAGAQSRDPGLDRAATGWNEVFRRTEMPEISPQTSFAAYCAERLFRENSLRPGNSAMVLAMGDGRNALYLAGLGLDVTGVDISSVGLEKARQAAAERGVEIETIQADLFAYDLGEGKWDLVTNIFFNPSIVMFDRIRASVRPGGYLVVEGYGSDFRGSGPAAETRYGPNQLLAELSNWRILEYQDGIFPSDWAGGQPVPVVRILAQKPR